MPPTPSASTFLDFYPVTCCNGAQPAPYAADSVWPLSGYTIQGKPVLDSKPVLETGFPNFSGFGNSSTAPLASFSTAPAASCVEFRLAFQSKKVHNFWLQNNGSLVCECSKEHFGADCRSFRASSVSGSGGGSFRIFLLLAVVPLSFALFAGIGGFLCRICWCDCFGLCSGCFWLRKQRKPQRENNAEFSDDDQNESSTCLSKWFRRRNRRMRPHTRQRNSEEQNVYYEHVPVSSLNRTPNTAYGRRLAERTKRMLPTLQTPPTSQSPIGHSSNGLSHSGHSQTGHSHIAQNPTGHSAIGQISTTSHLNDAPPPGIGHTVDPYPSTPPAESYDYPPPAYADLFPSTGRPTNC